MGLQVVQPVGGDLACPHPGLALLLGERAQRRESGLVGRHDETALGLVLDLRWEDVGEVAPESGGQQREVELGARLLVGDEQIAFPRTGGAARDGTAVDHRDAESGAPRVVRAGRADDSGADDHGVEGVSLGHHSNMSHSSRAAKGPERSESPRPREPGRQLRSGPSQE